MDAHPLSLDDKQLEIVMTSAALVDANFRTRFLEGVADFLLGVETITDEAVEYAAGRVLIGCSTHLKTQPWTKLLSDVGGFDHAEVPLGSLVAPVRL